MTEQVSHEMTSNEARDRYEAEALRVNTILFSIIQQEKNEYLGQNRAIPRLPGGPNDPKDVQASIFLSFFDNRRLFDLISAMARNNNPAIVEHTAFLMQDVMSGTMFPKSMLGKDKISPSDARYLVQRFLNFILEKYNATTAQNADELAKKSSANVVSIIDGSPLK